MSDLLSVEFKDGGLIEALNRAAQQLQNPRDLLDVMGATLVANISVRFQTKTDPQGNAWAQLKPSTQAHYAKKFKNNVPGTLLRRDFNGPGLFKGITHNLVGNDAVEVGTPKAYAFFHEFGTKKMERRGIFLADPDAGTLGADDEADLDDNIKAFLDELFGA